MFINERITVSTQPDPVEMIPNRIRIDTHIIQHPGQLEVAEREWFNSERDGLGAKGKQRIYWACGLAGTTVLIGSSAAIGVLELTRGETAVGLTTLMADLFVLKEILPLSVRKIRALTFQLKSLGNQANI